MKTSRPNFNLSAVASSRPSTFDPLRNCKPQQLAFALDRFRAGWLRELALIMDAQEERDYTLASVVPKTKAAVARLPWDVLTCETRNDSDAKLAHAQKEILENFYNQLRVRNALDQDEIGGVALLIRQMMDAKSKRYACHNIVWRRGAMPTAELWFTPLWFFENTTGKMRFLDTPHAERPGVEMQHADWLVTKGIGLGIACSVAWLFKQMSLRDWLLYNGRCGLPGFEGITDSTPGSPQWQNMVNAVANAASEFRWVRNRTDEIKTISFSKEGELPFPALVERMERTIAALWRGGDLSTISAGNGGGGLGANVQSNEAASIEQDDAQWLSETLQAKLDRLVLDYAFGEDVPALAYFKLLSTNKRALDLDMKVDDLLIRCGHPVSWRQAAERYNRPLPDARDGLLHP